MSEWKFVPLEELAANEKSAISKPYGSAIVKEDYRPTGVPVVRGVNLSRGIFFDDDFVFIEGELAARIPGAEMRPGDLVVTHRGTIGQVSMIPREAKYPRYVASTSHVKVRLDHSVALPEFYYYWFASPAGQRSIIENTSAVGVPGIAQPVATVKRLLVPQPALSEQRAIAEVLGALDDKIEVNHRITRLCLELAETRFATAVREVPFSGETIGDLADVFGGGTPKSSVDEYWNGDIPWATPTDVTALSGPYLFGTGRMITEKGLSACSSKIYPAGSILMTSRATIGAFAIAQVPTAVNQGFMVVNAKDSHHQWWLFHEMRSRVSEFVNHANGATFLELSRGEFKHFQVRLPDVATAKSFAENVGALHNRAAEATVENEKLSTTRDSLLPLLMSGKVRVRDAEKVVEEMV